MDTYTFCPSKMSGFLGTSTSLLSMINLIVSMIVNEFSGHKSLQAYTSPYRYRNGYKLRIDNMRNFQSTCNCVHQLNEAQSGTSFTFLGLMKY